MKQKKRTGQIASGHLSQQLLGRQLYNKQKRT